MNNEHLNLTSQISITQRFFTILLPFCGGYFLSYLFRSTNAVIAPKLIVEIGADAEQLGMLTSSYLLTFAIFQIPLGILLDKYGPRNVQIYLMIIASIGALLFALGEDIIIAGSAVASKLIARPCITFVPWPVVDA